MKKKIIMSTLLVSAMLLLTTPLMASAAEAKCDHVFANYVWNGDATCTEDGTETAYCENGCGTPHTRTVKNTKLGHCWGMTRTIEKTATLTRDGSMIFHCENNGCKEKQVLTIPKISTVKLSATQYTYNGKTKTPSVIVKDKYGTSLEKDLDYTVSYSSSSRKSVGTYTVTVTFIGNYSGSKKLTFTIYPAAPSKVTSQLYGYKSVKVSWTKVTGATAYKVYYKKASAKSYTLWTTTTATSLKKAFTEGTKYTFKVVPCYGKDKKAGTNSKTTTIVTLKKVGTPKVTRYASDKVKVSWTNIDGESGYQISYGTSKSASGTIKTYNGSSLNSKVLTVKKNTTYYYKVRAYKTVDGQKIYGPWSSVKSYNLK